MVGSTGPPPKWLQRVKTLEPFPEKTAFSVHEEIGGRSGTPCSEISEGVLVYYWFRRGYLPACRAAVSGLGLQGHALPWRRACHSIHMVEALAWWVADDDDTAASERQELAGVGIGVEQSEDRPGVMVVVALLPDGPAHRSGKVGMLDALDRERARESWPLSEQRTESFTAGSFRGRGQDDVAVPGRRQQTG